MFDNGHAYNPQNDSDSEDDMTILLSHNSALERLRAIPPAFDHSKTLAQALDLSIIRPTRNELRQSSLKALGIRQLPAHVLCHEDTPRSKSNNIKAHTQSATAIPGNLVRIIGDGAYAAGPELVFLQMAQRTSLLGLVALGYELCGSYSHFGPLISGFYERNPLTSVKRISDALDLLGRHSGISEARKALRYVLDGSASPMETVFACMLVLPNDLGGEGLVFPNLNWMVELDTLGKKMTGHGTAQVDIAWPDKKIGLEYNGGPYHTDPQTDQLRREALSRKEWRIYTADIDRMVDYGKYSNLLGLVEDEIPRRSGAAKPEPKDSAALFKRLMKATRAGIGLNPALFNVDVPWKAVKVHVG